MRHGGGTPHQEVVTVTKSKRLGPPGELDGLDVYADDGEKIGGVDEVYLDDRTGRPEWVTVRTGLLGLREHFVPLAGAV
ncbi:PRC-barrel domain containing protein, partial [Streptomyces sp. SID11233]|nr:PRC-barrel domain containing protein [Streptomyces sp. SID11233]